MLERRKFTKNGASFINVFVTSLMRSDRFLMDAEGLMHHIGK